MNADQQLTGQSCSTAKYANICEKVFTQIALINAFNAILDQCHLDQVALDLQPQRESISCEHDEPDTELRRCHLPAHLPNSWTNYGFCALRESEASLVQRSRCPRIYLGRNGASRSPRSKTLSKPAIHDLTVVPCFVIFCNHQSQLTIRGNCTPACPGTLKQVSILARIG